MGREVITLTPSKFFSLRITVSLNNKWKKEFHLYTDTHMCVRVVQADIAGKLLTPRLYMSSVYANID